MTTGRGGEWKPLRDYIKLSSDEIADEIDAIVNGTRSEVF